MQNMGANDGIEEAHSSENSNQPHRSQSFNVLDLSVDDSTLEESVEGRCIIANEKSNEEKVGGGEDINNKAKHKRAVFSFKNPKDVRYIKSVNSAILDPSVI